ncbi:GNAT family N-acetyltransferase, partial [Streptomyces sp. NPDC001193]
MTIAPLSPSTLPPTATPAVTALRTTAAVPAAAPVAAPPALPATPHYTVRLARDEDEVRAAQRLRHLVFAGELGARLDG